MTGSSRVSVDTPYAAHLKYERVEPLAEILAFEHVDERLLGLL
jgi:hypothetical protein